MLGLRLAAAGCGVVVTILLTRHLGPSRFGELSLVFTLAFLASGIGELGTTSVVAAEMAGRPERRRQLAAGFAVLRVAAGTVLALVAVVVLVTLVPRQPARWAGLAVLATVPLAGVTALAVLAQARLRPEVGAALSFGQSLLWLIAVVGASAAGADLAVFGFGFLACMVAQAVATWLAVVRPEPPAWGEWRDGLGWILRRGWPLAAATVLGTVYYRLDGVLVFGLRGEAEAGVYAAAYRFLDVSQLLPIALTSVLLPVMARRWSLGDGVGFQAVVRVGVTVAAAAGGLMAVVSVVCGDRAAVALFGPAFAESGEALRLLGAAMFSVATGYVYASALIAMGDVKVVAAVAAIAVVMSVAAGVFAISRWGAIGAAGVTVAVEFFVSTTLAAWLHRRRGVRFPGRRVGGSLAAAGVVVAVGWPLRGLPVVVLVAMCVALYVVAAAAFGAITRDEVRAIVDRERALGAGS